MGFIADSEEENPFDHGSVDDTSRIALQLERTNVAIPMLTSQRQARMTETSIVTDALHPPPQK